MLQSVINCLFSNRPLEWNEAIVRAPFWECYANTCEYAIRLPSDFSHARIPLTSISATLFSCQPSQQQNLWSFCWCPPLNPRSLQKCPNDPRNMESTILTSMTTSLPVFESYLLSTHMCIYSLCEFS